MRILIILDPLNTIKIAKDTTYSMMVAAVARGHELSVCQISDLSFSSTSAAGERVTANTQALTLTGEPAAWFSLTESSQTPLARFDAVMMRTDPPFDMEYVYATYMLQCAEAEGARVFNSPQAIRDHNEKFSIATYPELTAPTLVTRSPARLRAFVKEHKRAIFKLLDGMGGTSIFQARDDDPNLSVIIETMNQFGQVSVMAQKFLPDISAGDKRILLIGGKVVPHALARIPAEGEVRGNMAAGGKPVAQDLSESDLRIAEYLAPKLWSRGLFLVGLDVIGESVTEINVTSPTGFQEIHKQTGFDVPTMFITELERAVQPS